MPAAQFAAPIVNLHAVEATAVGVASEGQRLVDLSGIVHDRATHADLVPLSVLAWWLLSADVSMEQVVLRVPNPGTSPLRHLGRAGVLTAAAARGMEVVHSTGAPFEFAHLHSDASKHAPRLPGIDWAVVDEVQAGDRLRLIPDLADLRRCAAKPVDGKLAYPWLANLGIASPAISAAGYRRLLTDADAVLGELIENVHRWSDARRAFASVSLTRGGALDGDARDSWNRIHLVIADDGIGIPSALRADLAALAAVHAAADDLAALDTLDDQSLVERLLRHAFGKRELPNHNGHGLNVAQIRAGQWIGAFDVVTIDSAGRPFRRGSRGLSPVGFEQDDHQLRLPGLSGTLVHLMLQGTDNSRTRESAASAEQLPLDPESFDQLMDNVYADAAS